MANSSLALQRMTLQEIFEDLVVHDQSLASIAQDMKQHAVSQASWASHMRTLRMELSAAENDLELFVAQAVTNFNTDGKAATAVQNYAKFTVPTLPQYTALKNKISYLKNTLSFSMDVNGIYSKRADMLISLSRLDQQVILSQNSEQAQVTIRAATLRANRLDDLLHQPWGQGQL